MEFLIVAVVIVCIVVFAINVAADTEKEQKQDQANSTIIEQKKTLDDQFKLIKELREKPYNKIYHGPVFENIRNSTVINGSTVIGSLNKIGEHIGEEFRDALIVVAEEIEKNKSGEAGELFESFTKELEEEKPKKSVLKQLWKGIVDAVPTINTIANISVTISKLFI